MRKIIFVLLVLILVGCEPNESIKIGVNTWPPCEVWYIAEAQGYFEGLDVEIIRFSSWSDNMASLYKGNTDVTHSTYFNSVYYADKGIDGVILAPIDYIEGADGLVVKEDIEDIRGITIGVEVGTDEHFLLSKYLSINDISLEEIQLQSIPSYTSYNDFINNDVQALFTYEPFLSKSAKEGNGKIVFTTTELPNYMIDVLVVAKDNNSAETYQKLMTAWYKSLEYIKTNPEESYEIMAMNEDMSPEEFGLFFESFIFYEKNEALELLESKNVLDKLNEINTFTHGNNLTTEPIDVKSLLLSPVLEIKSDENK